MSALADTGRVVTLVGNPRPASRTRAAAEAAAGIVARRLGLPGPGVTIELADLAPQVFAAERPDVDAALALAAGARLLVVATPVYKASYTGLLKAFLDGYGPRGLDGIPVVPLVVSASPVHAHAGDAHLLPLLAELGAVVPASALALLESELGHVEAATDRWFDASWVHELAAAPGGQRQVVQA
ncbi:NADPH-dependent FMN reductase [Cellulomonas alba]|uniref:NAD(P)H-dependent oxidoreductase n=1 Tax=Cellulomonas alba TaxID=3053467 RepID=A0ABT7SF67_9CELL|nr:NAD(P)H-dependent oxidoreductase [Cellulomonas alba]MDM7854829.1 NAD(P)H-dependent oxidoreductase [Cellulomonas alba]